MALPLPAHAAEQDVELWTVAQASGSLSGRLLGSFEISIRSSDKGTQTPTKLIRPAIGIQASKAVSLWLGYARVSVSPEGRPPTRENRLFQQVQWTIGTVAGGTLSSRTRLEERFVEGRAITGWRFRQQLRWQRPLKAGGPSIVVSTEPFIALNRTDFGATPGIDQWRTFAGLSLPVAKGLSLETGYLNRYVRRAGLEDRVDHILPIIVSYRF